MEPFAVLLFRQRQKAHGIFVASSCIPSLFFSAWLKSFSLSGYFDARALAVDYRTLGFRECVGEVVRYLSSLEGESPDPIGARLVSHLSHCASELDPLLLQTTPASTLPFPPWPWASFPQISPTSPASSSSPFPSGRRDLALLGSYPSPASLRLAPLAGCQQGVPPLLAPTALATVHRVPSLAASPVLAPSRPTQPSPHSASRASPLPIPTPSSSSPSTTASSSTSSSSAPPQISFRPFAPLGSPTAQRRGLSGSGKSAQGWVTEIGAFWGSTLVLFSKWTLYSGHGVHHVANMKPLEKEILNIWWLSLLFRDSKSHIRLWVKF